MPTLITWPLADRAFAPREFRWGAHTPKSAFSGFFSGNTQSVSHLADRLLATLVLPPCEPLAAARREAFVMEAISGGYWVRLGHPHRQVPGGTLRGGPTVAAAALAGARQLSVQGVAGDTLLGGDVLGAPGPQLLLVGYAGAVASGAGVLTVPLVHPLRVALAAGAALSWQAPVCNFEISTPRAELPYGRAGWQGPVEISLREVY